MMQQQHHTRCQ